MLCGLPKSIPNRLIEEILGNLGKKMECGNKLSDYKLTSDIEGWNYRPEAFQKERGTLEELGRAPRCLMTLWRIMYSKRCNHHGKLTNQEHLMEHSIRIDILGIWKAYGACTNRHQRKKYTKYIRSVIRLLRKLQNGEKQQEDK